MIRRLWKHLHRPDGIVLGAGQTGAGNVRRIDGSVSPIPFRSLDVNPRREPCCRHCHDLFAPAPCPLNHTIACPECERDEAS